MSSMRIIYATLLAIGLTAGCSRPAADTGDGKSGTGGVATKAPVTFDSVDGDLTVFVFSEQSGDFIFEKSVSSGWKTIDDVRYTLTTDLTVGRYKFLFAKSFGNTLKVDPTPAPGVSFDETGFVLDRVNDDYYAAADELYLQHDDTQDASYVDPAKVYAVNGKTSVSVKLKRAVGQVNVNLKRGYVSGYGDDGAPQMVAVKYDSGDHILNYIEDIELTVRNVGSRVGIGGGEGSVDVYYGMASADADTDSDGFASFEGPFVIPNGTPVTVDVKINPKEGSGLPVLRKNGIVSPLKRNQQLVLDLWLDRVWPEIIVTLTTEEITDLRAGDSGIWD